MYFVPDVAGGFGGRGGGPRRRVYPISDAGLVRAEVVTHGVPDWIYEGRSVGRGERKKGKQSPGTRVTQPSTDTLSLSLSLDNYRLSS